MNKLKNTTYNFIFSTISQIVTIVLGVVLPRVILVNYGSEINGLLSSVIQLIAYLVLFEAGIQAVATKSLYKTIAQEDRQGTNGILAAVHKNYKRIGVLYCLGLLGLSVCYPLFFDVAGLSKFSVFLIVFFSGFSNVIAFFYQAKYKILLTVDGREYVLTNLNTITNVLTFSLKIVLFATSFPVPWIIILSFGISLIQTVFVLYYVRKKYAWIDLDAKPDMSSLDQSKHALIHQISGLVFSNTDVLLLTVFCDLKVVSVYTVYKLVLNHISTLLSMPLASCSFALGQAFYIDKKKYGQLLDSFQVAFAALCFGVLTIAYRLLLPFVNLYTDGVTDIVYADTLLVFLFVFAEAMNLIRVPTRHTVNCAGHFKETLTRTIIETVINLVISIVGVLLWGIYGVLLGTIVALVYRSIDFILYANLKILGRSAKKNFLLYALNFALSVVIIAALEQINFNISSWWRFVFVGFVITIPVLGLFAFVNFILFKKEFMYILIRLKKMLFTKFRGKV